METIRKSVLDLQTKMIEFNKKWEKFGEKRGLTSRSISKLEVWCDCCLNVWEEFSRLEKQWLRAEEKNHDNLFLRKFPMSISWTYPSLHLDPLNKTKQEQEQTSILSKLQQFHSHKNFSLFFHSCVICTKFSLLISLCFPFSFVFDTEHNFYNLEVCRDQIFEENHFLQLSSVFLIDLRSEKRHQTMKNQILALVELLSKWYTDLNNFSDKKKKDMRISFLYQQENSFKMKIMDVWFTVDSESILPRELKAKAM